MSGSTCFQRRWPLFAGAIIPSLFLVVLLISFVFSIKFDKTGFLSLTEAGLQEIGRCDQVNRIYLLQNQLFMCPVISTHPCFTPTMSLFKVNFHPHSKEPPLFEEATHVEVDSGSRVTLKDLR